ncbi:MAG: asparagine--tRNA ligase [Acidobacteria bacterium]|nr:asparagine--tRNA ligase [Acidobacteriota bacterium]
MTDAPRITIEKAADFAGQTVVLQGWVHNLRKSGKIAFPIFRDGTGFIQGVVVKANVGDEIFEAAKHLTQESSVRVRGQLRAEDRAEGGYEIEVEAIEILQAVSAEDPFPITPKEHGIDFLLDRRHLWLRSRLQHAIARVRHSVVKASRDFFDNNGFTLADTPILTPAACEGTTTLFETPYFDLGSAYLSQSGQLYSEATAMALGKVYCFGPTFRAEKSKTRRHLTEFWMVEPEMPFVELDGIMDLAEEFVEYVVARVLEERQQELKTLERDTSKLESVKRSFPRMTYDDAVKMLQAKGSEIQWGADFGNTDEGILSEGYDRPIMVHRFPTEIKAFYMRPDPTRPEVALGVDVIAPEGYGELIGGGQRIHEYDDLVKKIDEHGLPREAFDWFLDLRKYGSVPHGGFGMGIERCVAWICGIEHVRETIAFPRMIHRVRP